MSRSPRINGEIFVLHALIWTVHPRPSAIKALLRSDCFVATTEIIAHTTSATAQWCLCICPIASAIYLQGHSPPYSWFLTVIQRIIAFTTN